MIRTLYLAGPDVFLPDAVAIGRRKVELCKEHGFEGLFPADNEIEAASTPNARGYAIYDANVALMLRADAILANLTPFRGPSADAGTVFELGFFAGMGKPVWAYSSDARDLADRTRVGLNLAPGSQADREGAQIEDFGLADNLMLAGAIARSGGAWVVRQAAGPKALAAFQAFKVCLQELKVKTGVGIAQAAAAR